MASANLYFFKPENNIKNAERRFLRQFKATQGFK